MITKPDLESVATYSPENRGLIWTVRRFGTVPGQRVGTLDKEGYRRVRLSGRQYFEHRLVWLWHHGSFPRILDHISRDRDDNRIENLRLCNESQNAANTGSQRHNTSGYRGVYYEADRDKWVARIRFVMNGQRVRRNLGRFDTPEEAAIVYNAHMIQYFKEYAFINRVETPLGKILGMG